MSDFALPASYYFQVRFTDQHEDMCSFQEAEGLGGSFQFETQEEGRQNRFVHKVPVSPPRPNIRLKRGVLKRASPLMRWCKETLENDLSRPIQTRGLMIYLVYDNGGAIASWEVANAYPVKWEIAGFDEGQNGVAMESLDVSYLKLSRKT